MARVFQDTRQKRKLGRKAPWHVEWRVAGKRHSRKIGGKMAAEQFAKQVEGQLLRDDFGLPSRKGWAEFRDEYQSNVLPGMRSDLSRKEARQALNAFERLMNPVLIRSVDRKMLDEYVAIRRQMPGRKHGSSLSPDTIRKELRTIRAALSYAHEWGYLPSVPSMPKIEGYGKLKRYMTWDHFRVIWLACDQARLPNDFFSPSDWWRALLKVFWVTGVRVGSVLTCRWDDLDRERDILVLPAQYTKQKKDHVLRIAQAKDDLLMIRQFKDERIFPWNHHRRTLDQEWHRIQTAAGIDLACPQADQHECTSSCHLYGFHDIRRSHATYNHGRVDDRELQKQMGHATFQTTQGYILYAEKVTQQHYDAFLPEILPGRDDVKTTCDRDAV